MPSRFSDFEMHYDDQITDEGDLVHLALMAEATQVTEAEALNQAVWKEAMVEELKSIEKNRTWDLVDLPKDKHQIVARWVLYHFLAWLKGECCD
ncbi:hypothetical protein Lalb_Chr01g0022601 [Lupinus albus]|uniref:Uncharacterized protein n=1 Tax=Lupinus albus TaxID=3870 RepID=A0A6A4R5R0_LUPAL|nr:hypothetical protein Lalb_Chr01g0022601 [Lupinus albus]